MSTYNITPQNIYDATNGGLDVILAYFPQAQDAVHKKGFKFKLRGEEKTPSATLKKIEEGVWVVTDFGGDAKPRNCIEIVREEENLKFYEALQHIAARFNIIPADKAKDILKADYTERAAKPEEKEGEWDFEVKTNEEITENELRTIYSEKVILSKKREELLETFNTYNFHVLKSFTIIKNRKAMTFSPTDFFPIYMFDEGDWKKLYQPKHLDKSRRFMSYGPKPKDYLFGLKQLINSHAHYKSIKAKEYENLPEEEKEEARKNIDDKFDEVILATGGSDGLNVAALGYKVLWMNSETALLKTDQYKAIMECTKELCNLPDIDATGKRQAHELAVKYLDIKTIRLPEELKERRDWRGNPCKDVKDYLKYWGIKSLKNLVKTALPYKFWGEKAEFDRNGNYKTTSYQPKNKRLYHFLAGCGFYQMKVNNGQNDIYIQIKGNIVTEVSPKEIRKYINDFLSNRYFPEELCDTFLRTTQLNATSFENLPFIEIDFSDTDRETQYLFFLNKTWEVTKAGIKEYKPGAAGKFVWEEEVIKHRVTRLDNFFTVQKDEHTGELTIEIHNRACPFFNFLINTTRTHWRVEELGVEDYDEENKKYIRKTLTQEEKAEHDRHLINRLYTIGYLLHRYKDPSRSWAVWAMESKLTEEGESSGGSGKSIMMSYPKYLMKTEYLPGKNNKMTENKHLLENVTEHTDYIIVDDAHEYLNFTFFFPMITGPWTINPKNTKSFTLEYGQSPKMGFSSNFPPRNNDPSTERRILYTVFSDYYHDITEEFPSPKTPRDDYGKNLFQDFSEEEWNLALNLGAQCIQLYLNHTKISPPMENVTQRQLKGEMGDAFLAWADVYFSSETEKLNTNVVRSDAMKDFKDTQGIKDWSSKKFGSAIKAWCKFYGHTLNPKDLQNGSGRIIEKVEGKSQEMIHIRTKPKNTGDDLPF